MKNEEKLAKNEMIKTIVQTLETIPVAGYENHNKIMGIYVLLQELAKDGEEDGTLPNSK